MTVKSSAAPWSYTTSISLVALLIYSATSAAAADLVSDYVIPNRNDTLHAGNDSHLATQYLGSTTNMTTQYLANTSEERAIPLELQLVTARIESQKMSVFSRNVKFRFLALIAKSPENLFTALNLEKKPTELYNTPEFQMWINWVYAKHPKNYMNLIGSTVAKHFDDKTLATSLLLAGFKKIGTKQEFAGKLLEVLLQTKWKTKSSDDVFTLLELEKKEVNLFCKPALSYWVNTIHLYHEEPDPLVEASKIVKQYYRDDLETVLTTGADFNTGDKAFKLFGRLLQTTFEAKSPKEVFVLLQLEISKTVPLLQRPAFQHWIDFIAGQNKKGKYKIAYEVLKNQFKETSIIVKDLIAGVDVDSKKSNATEIFKWLCRDVWEGKSHLEIFNLLPVVKKEGEMILINRAYILWKSYMITKGDYTSILIKTGDHM